jgi:hypothetical protein
MSTDIDRLLEHFRIRPTYEVADLIYAILKRDGYRDRDIPTVPVSNVPSQSPQLTNKDIGDYYRSIKELLKTTPIPEEKKKNSKETFVYEESSMLPSNVYLIEEANSDKEENDDIDMSVISSSESDESVLSDVPEEIYEGYELNDSESDDFSE